MQSRLVRHVRRRARGIAVVRCAGWAGEIKKHTNLIAAFGRHIVQKGLLPVEFGKALNQAERIRRLADYTGDPIELDRAAVEVEQAERFVDAVNARFKDGASAD